MDSVRRPDRPRVLSFILLPLLLALPTAPLVSSALAAKGDCGQPSSSGTGPKSSDALFALKAAVGTSDCDLCVCDVTTDSKITASDALRILKRAVGQSVTLTCPACVPSLTGVVMIPWSMAPLQSGSLQAVSPDPAAVNSELPIAGLMGLTPASGVTVELLDLDSEGNVQLPAVATATTKADGSYKLQPAPTPSSLSMVRAGIDGQYLRAFVSNASSLKVDPASDFIVDTAIQAVKVGSGAGLGDLSVDEIAALVRELRQTEIDVGLATTSAHAHDILMDRTGDFLVRDIGSFATSSGASPSVAGNFHLVNLGAAFMRTYTPATDSQPSVNERRVHMYATADPLTIDGSGLVTQPLASGRSHTLKEVSGSQPQVSGPDLAINATATLESQDVNETPGSSAGHVLAGASGEILFNNPEMVGTGALAAGSGFAVLSAAARTTTGSSNNGLGFLLRQGSGMSKSSLTGTWWMVHLEFEMEASTAGNVVNRSVGARTSTHTATFDGNGGFSISAAEDTSGRLRKTGPTPDQDPVDPAVTLEVSQSIEDANSGLTYTVDPNGTLTAKSGDTVIGVGAVSADQRILVLRVGDDEPGFGDSGIIIGLKRGTGMNTSSASGFYRSLAFMMRIEASLTPGQVDVSPSTNQRSVAIETGLSLLDMDGVGQVGVGRGFGRSTRLGEISGVQQYTSDPDLVLDASVDLSSYADGEGDGSETHSYSVESNGKVSVDGAMTGYLSSDGKVFLLPIPESEATDASTGLLIALRQP